MNTFEPKLSILPPAQKELWPELAPIKDFGFVLYGGTAIALRLGHRTSVDFDFFSAGKVDREKLCESLPFLTSSSVLQERENTFEVLTQLGVKVSFFGGLDFGRVGEPETSSDGVLVAASLEDLMATKVKVILQRNEAKDYQDIAAMARAGVRIDVGLAAATQMFHPFPTADSVKAMTYFEGGDLTRLSVTDRQTLITSAANIRPPLPGVSIQPNLTPDSDIPDFP
jgi:hypothetical protein